MQSKSLNILHVKYQLLHASTPQCIPEGV